jgi:hypothetical protein
MIATLELASEDDPDIGSQGQIRPFCSLPTITVRLSYRI